MRQTRCRLVAVVGLVGLGVACGGSLTSPDPDPVGQRTGPILPSRGLVGDTVLVEGNEFVEGATVTFDGIPARVTGLVSVRIVVAAPPHPPGFVNVVVTNPGMEGRTVQGGFTYEVATLAASPEAVKPGGPLTVSFTAPAERGCIGGGDWIGLHKVGDVTVSANGHSDLWYEHLCAATFGSWTISAPTEPGVYEFRYNNAAARSNSVTVSN